MTLPNLRSFSFRGGSDYLESLLTGIGAPVLTSIDIKFFHELDIPVPHLLQFIQSSTFLVFKRFELIFNDSAWGNSVAFVADPRLVSREYLYLNIRCQHLDLQVFSAEQILDTLSPVLTVVEKLTLTYIVTKDPRSTVFPVDLIDRMLWREILRSFSGVKTLHIEDELVGAISRSLRSNAGESPLELLPNLEELTYSKFSIGDRFMPFLKQRQAAGYPVTVRLESKEND